MGARPTLPTASWLVNGSMVALDPCPRMPNPGREMRAMETLVRYAGSPRDFVVEGNVQSVTIAGVAVRGWARMPWGPRIVEWPLGWDLSITGTPLRAAVAWVRPAALGLKHAEAVSGAAATGSDPFWLDQTRGWVPL